MSKQKNIHEVEFSFLYMHYKDALKFHELAKRRKF